MMDDHEFEWTAEERAALDRMPRELAPDRMLKDRVRTALRARGRLRGHRGGRWFRAAAGLALFLAGALAGRLTVTAQPHGFVAATDSVLAPAEHVQAAGSAYVETVARLVALHDSLPAGTADQGRGATLSALRGAAEHAVRLPGLDAGTVRALMALRGAGGP